MIALYGRVSTQEQQSAQTIQTQLYAVRKYASEHGLVIEKEYVDDGVSGSVLARPSLDQLREDVKSGLITKIVAYHPDRLSRKQSFQFLLLDEFEKAGIDVVFTALPEYSSGGKESQIVNKSIFAMISELERVRISERFRLGKLRKVSENKLVTSFAPYGYKYIPSEKMFVFDRDEIETVKKILRWAKLGESVSKIILNLKDEGIKTRKGKLYWAKSTISKILGTNLEAYAGHWNFNKHRSTVSGNPNKAKYLSREKTSRRINEKTEWLNVELPKELRIITDQDVKTIRGQQLKNKAVKRFTTNKYLLRGKLFCDDCGGLAYSDTSHGRGFYKCGDKKRKFPSLAYCKAGSLSAESLEASTWETLSNFISNKDLVKKELERYVQRNKAEVSDGSELKALLAEKEQLEAEKVRLNEGFAKGLLDDAEMIVQKTRIKARLAQIDLKQSQLLQSVESSKIIDIESMGDEVLELIKEELSTFTFEEKQKTLDALGIKVLIHENEYRIEGQISLKSRTLPTTYL